MRFIYSSLSARGVTRPARFSDLVRRSLSRGGPAISPLPTALSAEALRRRARRRRGEQINTTPAGATEDVDHPTALESLSGNRVSNLGSKMGSCYGFQFHSIPFVLFRLLMSFFKPCQLTKSWQMLAITSALSCQLNFFFF